MLGVRFPTGVLVRYNEATHFFPRVGDDRLLLKNDDGDVIAVVPTDCVIEMSVADGKTERLPYAALTTPDDRI